jgi:hypothetical protein
LLAKPTINEGKMGCRDRRVRHANKIFRRKIEVKKKFDFPLTGRLSAADVTLN